MWLFEPSFFATVVVLVAVLVAVLEGGEFELWSLLECRELCGTNFWEKQTKELTGWKMDQNSIAWNSAVKHRAGAWHPHSAHLMHNFCIGPVPAIRTTAFSVLLPDSENGIV
jgi:hypothetical protein